MVRSNKGQAIGEAGRSVERVRELREFTEEAEAQSDLKAWVSVRRIVCASPVALSRHRSRAPCGERASIGHANGSRLA